MNKFGSQNEYFSFQFMTAHEPKDGKISILGDAQGCREGLIGRMREQITSSRSSLKTDKTRLIFKWQAAEKNLSRDTKIIDGWVKRAINVLHACERKAGWPLTRVYKIDVGDRKWLKLYYFHASRRWMKASYLISLYVLLVRMCKDERVAGFKDFSGLVAKVKKIMGSGHALKTDHGYVKDSYPYWEAVLTGYPDLFRKRKMPYYWDTSRLGGSSMPSSEGIQYLVKGDTRYTEVREKLIQIKKKLDKKSK
ncbi:MAG: hypothetical protein R3356_01945 [Eudoraea sp.]|nr:hypothetical protein [Eudoraea sp.]